jgi:hypothetical protein
MPREGNSGCSQVVNKLVILISLISQCQSRVFMTSEQIKTHFSPSFANSITYNTKQWRQTHLQFVLKRERQNVAVFSIHSMFFIEDKL